MKNKKILIIIGVVVVAAVVMLIIDATIKGGSQDEASSIVSQSSAISSIPSKSDESEALSSEVAAGTSAKVDEIARKAKEDSAKIDDEKTNEAVSYIREHFDNYFENNEVMEQTMYYGYLLEYAYKDDENNQPYAVLGQDVYQVVKYVYRGAETIDSDSVQSNLRQVEKDLKEIK